jgi:hypothetical protein
VGGTVKGTAGSKKLKPSEIAQLYQHGQFITNQQAVQGKRGEQHMVAFEQSQK